MGGRIIPSGMSDMTNEERKEEARLKELEGKDYQEFDDTSIKSPMGGSKEYHGDGQKQVDFFNDNSNYNDIINGMTYNQKEAYESYWSQGHFMNGQQWGGWDSMSKFDKTLTQIYDRTLDKSVLNKGVVVARLTSAELLLGKGNKVATSLEQLQALRGQVVISKANMSCGAAKYGLHIGDLSKNVEIKIHIPAGTKGAGMWIGDKRINDWGRRQREFITNRDTAYRIGNTTTRTDHNGIKIYVVNLYYDGRQKHDYGKSGMVNDY